MNSANTRFKTWLHVIACIIILLPVRIFADANGPVEVGETLRDTTLWGLSGDPSAFSIYRGKPLLINVWASHCGPCREEMASLNQLAQQFDGKQFNVIGVSIDDDIEAANLLVKTLNLSFKNFIDRNLIVEIMLGAQHIPLTVLVDSNGKILKKIQGARNWFSAETVLQIEQTFQIPLKP